MARESSQYREEVRVLREIMSRWDKRNWAELCVSVLKGPRGGEQIDYTMDVRGCMAFEGALKEIHRQRDEECSAWLQQAADPRVSRREAAAWQDAHRKSNRRMFWENSMYKFDHSARNKDGVPLRKREMMAEKSSVRAPELYNPKAMLAMIREDEEDEHGQDRHVESDDRRGAQVRDVEATILEVLDSA